MGKNWIGILGIVIALAGVGVAIFQDDLRPPPDPAATQLKDKALEKGAELLGIRTETRGAMDWVLGLRLGLGFVGIILGVVSWVRKENHRVSSAAAALGLVAVAWEYVLMAIAVAVLVLVLGAMS